MMRIARVVPMLFAMTFCSAAWLHAQPAGSTSSRAYAEFNVGATLGHKSDASIGAEGGYRLMPSLDVFAEGGHIGNAASADLDARATTIGNAVGASASAVAKVNYFDVGVRYHWPMGTRVEPYVSLGIGVANVKNETTLSVNGTVVPPENLGVAFGTDLSGSENSGFFMLGFGADVPFAKRYFVDLSYRYGRVLQKSEDSDVIIPGFNTNRIQAGLGIKF